VSGFFEIIVILSAIFQLYRDYQTYLGIPDRRHELTQNVQLWAVV